MTTDFRTVPAELAHALSLHRDRIAFRDGDLALSYGRLAAFTEACRAALTEQHSVAVYGAPGALFAAAATACVISGHPFVHLDPAMPKAVLDNILDELQIDVILTAQPPLADQLPQRCLIIDASSFLTAPEVEIVTAAEVDPTDAIYLVATSGTTGRPKCIPVTHDAAFLSYRWRDAFTPYAPGMTIGCYIFAIWEMFRPLRDGAEICFPGIADLMSPQALAGFIARHDLHEMLFTPSFFEKMLQGLDRGTASSLPLRRIILNGEVVGPNLLGEAKAKLGRVELWNLYSICETHDICMSELLGAKPKDGPGITVGKPMSHLRVIVLDDQDRPCPPGQPGLVHFEGPRMLGPGYVNRPEETAHRFRELVIEGRTVRLYDTGDQGFLAPDGQLVVLGRVAHMLKLRGHSIQTRELTETMASLIQFGTAIPWIQQVGDNGSQALVFYYTADNAQRAANEARWHIAPEGQRMPTNLAAELRELLPAYCVPTYLVRLDDIPIHAVSGKCDYRALPPITAPAPALDSAASHSPVLTHAARILNIAPAELDLQRSFHDQGGDSLMGIELVMALEKAHATRVDFDWALNLPLARLEQLLTATDIPQSRPAISRPGILLTGVTGFLGGHVLAEAHHLLPKDQVIYCLVRPGAEPAGQRLDAVAAAHGVPAGRVVLIEGSLEDAGFDLHPEDFASLCQKVSRAIHAAATVNLAVEREQMLAWSRAGLENILAFCHAAKCELHFSSTTSIFPEDAGHHPEELTADFTGCSGYGAAKIAAERMISRSDLPAMIVRLPSLYDLEAANPRDIYETILRACADLGAVPAGLNFPMIDVRAVARFLLQAPATLPASICNLIPDRPVDVASAMPGFPEIPVVTWLEQAELTDAVRRLIVANPEILSIGASYATARARAVWATLGLGDFSAISDAEALLTRRLDYQREPALT